MTRRIPVRFGRAYDTAEYILEGAKEQDLKVDQMAELDDTSWGDAEGILRKSLWKKYDLDTFPDAFGSADDPNFVSPIHAESKYDFCQRFSKGMDEIIADAEEGTDVLVVAHLHAVLVGAGVPGTSGSEYR